LGGGGDLEKTNLKKTEWRVIRGLEKGGEKPEKKAKTITTREKCSTGKARDAKKGTWKKKKLGEIRKKGGGAHSPAFVDPLVQKKEGGRKDRQRKGTREGKNWQERGGGIGVVLPVQGEKLGGKGGVCAKMGGDLKERRTFENEKKGGRKKPRNGSDVQGRRSRDLTEKGGNE